MNILKDKRITIYFDDESESGVVRKDGIGISLSNNSIIFKDNSGLIQLIPLYRVIRIIEKPMMGGRQ